MGVIGATGTLSAWAEEYGRRLGQLLPPGRFFRVEPGSDLERILKVIGTEAGRVRLAAESAFEALHPGRATGAALDAWEDALGLPECGGASTETDRRQQAAWAKFRAYDVIMVSGDLDGTPLPGRFSVSAVATSSVTLTGWSAASAQAAAPAGGTGATAGAYDTANNRNACIALVNAMRDTLIAHGLMKGAA